MEGSESALTALAENQRLPPSTRSSGAQCGWDPYEVWRTRVLLPRLAQNARSLAGPSAIRVALIAPRIHDLDIPSRDHANTAADPHRSDNAPRRELIDAFCLLLIGELAEAVLSVFERAIVRNVRDGGRRTWKIRREGIVPSAWPTSWPSGSPQMRQTAKH
jgi:hypothetical protein